MSSIVEEDFKSAVSLVQKLPKNGPFKPSDNVRLKLYGLYKQSTVGANNTPQPSFMWDPVGRYKWKAWSELQNMDKVSAMNLYVSELKQLVRDIPESIETEDFLKKFKSTFGGDVHAIESSSAEFIGTYSTLERSQDCVEVTSHHKLESDNEEFCDTVTKQSDDHHTLRSLDNTSAPRSLDNTSTPRSLETTTSSVLHNSTQHSPVVGHTLDNITEDSSDGTQGTLRKKRCRKSNHSESTAASSQAYSSDVRILDVESQILRTVRLMRHDVRGLLERMDTLENLLARHLLSQSFTAEPEIAHRLWDKRWFLFVVVWPVLTQIFTLWYVRKYHRRR